jgi:hypothetical protein
MNKKVILFLVTCASEDWVAFAPTQDVTNTSSNSTVAHELELDSDEDSHHNGFEYCYLCLSWTEQLEKLSCSKHEFCLQCSKKLCAYTGTCPYCRVPLEDAVRDREEDSLCFGLPWWVEESYFFSETGRSCLKAWTRRASSPETQAARRYKCRAARRKYEDLIQKTELEEIHRKALAQRQQFEESLEQLQRNTIETSEKSMWHELEHNEASARYQAKNEESLKQLQRHAIEATEKLMRHALEQNEEITRYRAKNAEWECGRQAQSKKENAELLSWCNAERDRQTKQLQDLEENFRKWRKRYPFQDVFELGWAGLKSGPARAVATLAAVVSGGKHLIKICTKPCDCGIVHSSPAAQDSDSESVDLGVQNAIGPGNAGSGDGWWGCSF